MSSDQEVTDILSTLTSCNIFDEIEKHLPDIIKYLETEMCSEQFADVLRILLKDSLKSFDLSSIQTIFLQDVLSVTLKIFNDSLDSIKFNLETESANTPTDTEFFLSQLLKVTLDILDGYRILLNEIMSLDSPFEACLLDSVPRIVIAVTEEALLHCRHSELNYGKYFSHCSNQLASLFRKSFEVERALLQVMDERFNFKNYSEDDISFLVSVLDKVLSIGEIVCSFELSAIVDQWKGFIKLVTKYSEGLKGRLNLTLAYSTLTSNINKIISDISSYQTDARLEESQMIVRHLKLANFVLRVVIKLYELNAGFITEESIKLLLQLLIIIYGQNEILMDNPDLSPLFKSYVTVGASPLLSNLLPEPTFILEFKEMCCNYEKSPNLTISEKLGAFTLTVNLVRKLVGSSEEIQKHWMDEDFVSCVLKIVSTCCPNVTRAVTLEEKEGYSTLVCSVAIIMTSILSAENFQKVEAVLFHSLIYGNFFAKICVEDLLCLLARLTTESVVVSWLDWLESQQKTSDVHSRNKYHPLLVHIHSLESRLLTFLSPKTRKARSVQSAESLRQIVDALVHQASPANFNSLITYLERCGDLEEDITSETEADIIDLWVCLRDTKPHPYSCSDTSWPRETAFKCSLWWCRLLNSLSDTTSKHIGSFNRLDSIFDVMHQLSGIQDSFVHLSFIGVISSLSDHMSTVSVGESKFNRLSLTVCHILLGFIRSADFLVKIISLETLICLNQFEIFSFSLDKVLVDYSDLSFVICNYFKDRTVDFIPSDESRDVFCRDVNWNEFVHKCSSAENSGPAAVEEPPAKKIKTVSPHEINQLIAKSKLLLKEIRKCLDEQTLSENQKVLLSDTISQYNQLKEYIH